MNKREREEEEEEDFELMTLPELLEYYVSQIEELKDEEREDNLEDLCRKMGEIIIRYIREWRDYAMHQTGGSYLDFVGAMVAVDEEKAEEVLGHEDEDGFYCSPLGNWQGEVLWRIKELTDPNKPYLYIENMHWQQALRACPEDPSKNQELLQKFRELNLIKRKADIKQEYINEKVLHVILNFYKDDPSLDEKQNTKCGEDFERDIRTMFKTADIESRAFEEGFEAKYPRNKRRKI